MRRQTLWRTLVMVVGLIALAGSVAAQNLPKLPADITLPQSADSPGKVTFSHQNHIGFQGRPDCTTCHPKLAPILGQKAQGKRGAITHDKMIKGQACGACHNGKDAHNFDDCSTCHK